MGSLPALSGGDGVHIVADELSLCCMTTRDFHDDCYTHSKEPLRFYAKQDSEAYEKTKQYVKA